MNPVDLGEQHDNPKEASDRGADAEHGPNVTTTVNGQPVTIHRGRRTVTEIKQAAHVPLAHDLELVSDGVLKPLADDGALVIKGGEVFVSHPKDAASS